jgi:hypothetical protein
MKVYHYQIRVFGSIVDYAHGFGETQTRLYVPERGVLCFRSIDKIDFFQNTKESIEEAERAIRGLSKMRGVEYIGEIDLPDKLVSGAVHSGEALNLAKKNFDKAAKNLLDLLKG